MNGHFVGPNIVNGIEEWLFHPSPSSIQISFELEENNQVIARYHINDCFEERVKEHVKETYSSKKGELILYSKNSMTGERKLITKDSDLRG